MKSLHIKEDGTNKSLGTVVIDDDNLKVSVNDPDLAEYLAEVNENKAVIRLADSGKSTSKTIVDGAQVTEISDPKFADALIGALYDQGYVVEKSSA